MLSKRRLARGEHAELQDDLNELDKLIESTACRLKKVIPKCELEDGLTLHGVDFSEAHTLLTQLEKYLYLKKSIQSKMCELEKLFQGDKKCH